MIVKGNSFSFRVAQNSITIPFFSLFVSLQNCCKSLDSNAPFRLFSEQFLYHYYILKVIYLFIKYHISDYKKPYIRIIYRPCIFQSEILLLSAPTSLLIPLRNMPPRNFTIKPCLAFSPTVAGSSLRCV